MGPAGAQRSRSRDVGMPISERGLDIPSVSKVQLVHQANILVTQVGIHHS